MSVFTTSVGVLAAVGDGAWVGKVVAVGWITVGVTGTTVAVGAAGGVPHAVMRIASASAQK